MSVNPEFRRNLWLEITPSRLVIMPVVLAAVVYLAFVSDNYRMAELTAKAASWLFFLICMVWGTKLASEAVMNEIRDHTWDGQRMSVITPWQLTWGKLFGSTVYAWYGALICIGIVGLSSLDRSVVQAIMIMLTLAAAGVLAHAVSLLASLAAIQKERKFTRSQTTALLLLGIIVAGPFMSVALNGPAHVPWFGTSYDGTGFLLWATVSYAAWAVVGVHHLMRRELQMKHGPWAWYGFMLFTMVFFAGFYYGIVSKSASPLVAASPMFLTAYAVAVTAVYLLVFAESKDMVSLQTVVRLAAARDWRRFLERSPRWILTLPVAVLAGIAVIVTAEADRSGRSLDSAVFVAASLFFMVRDMGIIIYCNLGTQARRADLFSIVCLVLLYGIFPAILSAMHANMATMLFWPRIDLSPLPGSMVMALLEAVLVALLVRERWKRRIVG